MVISFKREFRTSPSLLLWYVAQWVTGSGINRVLWLKEEYLMGSEGHLWVCCLFDSSILEINSLFLFSSLLEGSYPKQAWTEYLRFNSSSQREMSFPSLHRCFLPWGLVSILPHVMKPGN